MTQEILKLVEGLHTSALMTVLAVTGAGSRAITWLLGVPGASRTVLEALAPYSEQSLAEFIGGKPDQSVSAQTALAMARAAYRRAVQIRDDGVPVVGIGCTAAITTDRPRRGVHQCYVAAWSSRNVTAYSLELTKDGRDRLTEETIVSKLVLNALAESTGLDTTVVLDLGVRDKFERSQTRYDDAIEALTARHVESVTIKLDREMVADARVSGGILAGSFNPLHKGHEKLAIVASEILRSDVTFELSVSNVDKPDLEEQEIRRRVAYLVGIRPIVITRAKVFHEKARLFPGCTFVIGSDTATRLIDKRYYCGNEAGMLGSLVEIREQGCHVLVAGRTVAGRFQTLDDLAIPSGFEDMITSIPESSFRHDISSTQLRRESEEARRV